MLCDMRALTYIVLGISSLTCLCNAGAEAPEVRAVKVNHVRIATMMFSSAQRWTDHRLVGEFRLQNRTGSDAWRLLGTDEKVELTGSRAACEARLKKRTAKAAAEPIPSEIVVLVHGLFQTRATMEPMEMYLKESPKRRVINFGYASTKANIESHAKALEEVLADAGSETKVSFVGHSMGCIVTRALLANHEEAKWKVGRVVMIGPPNQGAEMARRMVRYPSVKSWLGPGFEQLADPKLEALKTCPAPLCEFAVIAGASPKWMLNNPLIEGEDDWIVGVCETKLEGAKCEACVDSHHGEIVHDERVMEMVDRFLKTGELTKPEASAKGK